MRVTFLLWAQIRVSAGTSRVDIDLPAGSTLDAALDAFYVAHPDLVSHRASARAAVGNEYAPGDRRLGDGDQISLIPPVQGG